MLTALAPSEVCRAGDIFVTVEKDLRWEGRMATHANRDVSPVLVPDMKIVMIHIRPPVPSAGYFRSCLPWSSAPPRPAPERGLPERETDLARPCARRDILRLSGVSFRRDHNRLHQYRWPAPSRVTAG